MTDSIAEHRDLPEAGDTAVEAKDWYILQNENVSVDVSMLYDISQNDKSFINTMVQTFLKNMPETLHKLDQSLKVEDWENVFKAAHSAKSSLSVIKIEHMMDWVVQVEENSKNKTSLESVPDLVEKIKQKFAFAKDILNDSFR